MRRRILVVAALAMSTLLVAGAAPAQEADAVPESDGTVLRGHGVLYAKGHGTALLNMGGTLRMHIRGSVAITDLAGDARILIDDGPDQPLRDRAAGGTTVVLDDFSGAISVRGRHLRVRAQGTMEFVAAGHGAAYLQGRGIWRTRHARGTWSSGGLVVDLAADAA